MLPEPVVPLGTQVSGDVEGWGMDEEFVDDGTDPPALKDAPKTVTGALAGWPVVPDPGHGEAFFKHIIAGYDVYPDTIKVLE